MPETSDERLLRRVLLITTELVDQDYQMYFEDSRGRKLLCVDPGGHLATLCYEHITSMDYDDACRPPTLAECFADLIAADTMHLRPWEEPEDCKPRPWHSDYEDWLEHDRARITPARFRAPEWDFDYVPPAHLAKLGPSSWHKQPSSGQAAG